MAQENPRRRPLLVAATALALLAGCESSLPRESELLGDLSELERTRGGESEQVPSSGVDLDGFQRVHVDHTRLTVGEGSDFAAISASGRQHALRHARAAMERELAQEWDVGLDPAEHGPDLLVVRTAIVDARTPRDGTSGLDLSAARLECEGRDGESGERLFALVLPAHAPGDTGAGSPDPGARDAAIVDGWARRLADWISERRVD